MARQQEPSNRPCSRKLCHLIRLRPQFYYLKAGHFLFAEIANSEQAIPVDLNQNRQESAAAGVEEIAIAHVERGIFRRLGSEFVRGSQFGDKRIVGWKSRWAAPFRNHDVGRLERAVDAGNGAQILR